MTAFFRNFNSWRRAVLVAVFVTLFTAAWVVVARGQDNRSDSAQPAVTPYAMFQASTLTGSGNTISAYHLPVVRADGKTVYWNFTMQFDVAADGTLTVTPDYPQTVTFPESIVDGYVAGTYSADKVGTFAVTGPSASLAGGPTVWSLLGSVCAYPFNGTWYDVGTSIKSNPIYARLQKAGIKSTAYAQFGVSNSVASCGGPNVLTGFSQVNNTLVIGIYTDKNGVDHSTSVSTQTYTLSQ